MHLLDPKLRHNLKSYIFQSLTATGVCCVMLVSLDVLIPGALVASLGASTFIVFVAPHTPAARPRALLGGQLIGAGSGAICRSVLDSGLLAGIVPACAGVAVFGSIAVGMAIFLMVIIDMEHPPAAGTALSLVMVPWTAYMIAFIAATSAFLTLARWAMRARLRNLC